MCLWEALRSFREAPRSFRKVFWGNIDAVAGYRGDLSCDFLARGGIPGCDFLPAEVFRTALCVMGLLFLAFVAFSAGNALLFSGICGIRYQKGHPTVRNMRAVLKKASYGTRRVFRGPPCSKQASGVRKEYSVPETPSYGTRLYSHAKNGNGSVYDNVPVNVWETTVQSISQRKSAASRRQSSFSPACCRFHRSVT